MPGGRAQRAASAETLVRCATKETMQPGLIYLHVISLVAPQREMASSGRWCAGGLSRGGCWSLTVDVCAPATTATGPIR